MSNRFIYSDADLLGITITRKSGLKYANGEFIVKEFDPDQPRDESGRWTDTGAAGASVYPAAEERAAFDRLKVAEKEWHAVADQVVRSEIRNERGYPSVDREKTPPEVLEKYDAWLKAMGDVWGESQTQEATGREYGISSQFRVDTYATVDSEGNPTDPGDQKYGTDNKLWDLRDLYVVPDDKTLAMNRSLRDGRSSTKADRIDGWVNSSTLIRDTVAYRGAALTTEQASALQPGFSYVDKGYQSTDYEPSGASSYLDMRMKDFGTEAGLQPVMFRYVVEAGTHAADAGYQEMVVQRNTTNTVVGRNEVDGTVYVTVRVAGNG